MLTYLTIVFELLALVVQICMLEKCMEFSFSIVVYMGAPVSTISISTIPDLTHLEIVVNRTNFLIQLHFSKPKNEIFEENSNEIGKFLQMS